SKTPTEGGSGSPDRNKKPRPCGRGFPMVLLDRRLVHRPFAGAEVLEQHAAALQIFLAQAFRVVGGRPRRNVGVLRRPLLGADVLEHDRAGLEIVLRQTAIRRRIGDDRAHHVGPLLLDRNIPVAVVVVIVLVMVLLVPVVVVVVVMIAAVIMIVILVV